MQRCPRCTQTLPDDAFTPSSQGINGTWCRACTAATRQAKRAADPERFRAQRKAYGEAHRSRVKAGLAAAKTPSMHLDKMEAVARFLAATAEIRQRYRR